LVFAAAYGQIDVLEYLIHHFLRDISDNDKVTIIIIILIILLFKRFYLIINLIVIE
jgi:hypothetical protein